MAISPRGEKWELRDVLVVHHGKIIPVVDELDNGSVGVGAEVSNPPGGEAAPFSRRRTAVPPRG